MGTFGGGGLEPGWANDVAVRRVPTCREHESTPAQSGLAQARNSRYVQFVRKPRESQRAPLFSPLPTRGVWSAVGLTRGQFFSILAVSIVMFLFLDGQLWLHTHDSHLRRIVWSYLVILPLVCAALYRNGESRIGTIVAASVVVGLVKLVVTAVILVAIGLARV